MDKEAEQTIAHALITKDKFLSLSLPRPLPLSVSVIFLSWLFFLPSPETFSVDERKQKLNIKTPRSPLNTCHLSFVQIMARVAIETVFFLRFNLFFFSLSLLVRPRERERGKTDIEKTTVNYMSVGDWSKTSRLKIQFATGVKDERRMKDSHCTVGLCGHIDQRKAAFSERNQMKAMTVCLDV